MLTFHSFMYETYTVQLVRQPHIDTLKIKRKGDRKWVEVRGKPNFEIMFDPKDALHQVIQQLGKASNISDLVNGEIVVVNPKHPHGAKAVKVLDNLYEKFSRF